MLRLLALAGFLIPLAVSAQQPAAPAVKKEEPQKLEKIEVQGDGLAERRESTAAKIIVNSDEITRYGDTNLLEVLKRLPGVTVDAGPGGRGGAIRMRGLSTGYTQILVNGERMPPGFTLDSIAPDMIDRIEIVRGATAEFSAQAVAGTINVVLKRALAAQRRELKVGASVEHDKPTFNASGQWADKSGAVSWTVPFQATRFAFVADGLNEQRVFTPSLDVVQDYFSRRRNEGFGANANIAPRLAWVLGEGNTLNLDAFALYNAFHGHFIEDNQPPRVGPPPPYVATDLRNRSDNQSYRVNGQWVRRFPGGGKIDAKLGVSAFEFDAGSTFVADGAGGVRTLERTIDSTIADYSLTTIGKYTLPIVKGHSISSGWDGAWTERNDTRLQQDLNPVTGGRLRLDEDFDTSIRRLALYAQDEWDVTERFAAYAGVRWEGIETRSNGNTFEAIRNRSSVASPILNLLWKLPGTQKDQVRMGLSRTYKPPQIGELVPRRFFSPNNTPVTPDFIGNPRLKPELAWGLDAAFEHYPAGGGNATVSFYHRRIEDIIQREVVFEDGLYISRPGNIGKGTVTGMELDAKGKLSQLWEGAPGVDLRANFALNRSRVDYLPGPHNRLDEQVPWNGTVGFDYRFAPTPLTIGSSFTARAGGTVRNSLSQVTYRSVNRQLEAYALWRFSPAVQLRLSVQNLLAQEALFINRFTDPGGITERASVDPRFRRFSFLWEFKL